MSVITRSVGLVGILALAMGCSACASAGPTASIPPRRATLRRSATRRTGPTSDASPTVPALQAPLGATLTLQDTPASTLSVSVQQLVDPGSGADALALPETGERLVGVVMQVTDRGGSVVTDVDADTTVVGSNGQTFGHVDDPLIECTPFPLGALALTPDAALQGCVTFELPLDISVSQIRFRPTAGTAAGRTGLWNVG